MHTTTYSRENNSLLGLLGGLREDVRNLFHEEVRLAKTELSEKVSHFGRNASYLAAGGAVGYLAINLVLVALSFLIGYAFEKLGLSTGIALFLGFLAMGVVIGSVGGILVGKALSGFKKESLAPEKTIESLKQIKEGGLEQVQVKMVRPRAEIQDHRSSAQIRSDVEQTRSRIGREVRGIRTQLSVAYLSRAVATRFSKDPLRSVGIGLGTGLAGFLIVRVARIVGRRHAT